VFCDFDNEYYCGFCGVKFKKDEIGYRKIFGVKIPIEWANDRRSRCPKCGNIVRQIPRTTKKE